MIERAKCGHAIVSVEPREPAGAWKKKWFSVGSNCHGCEGNCGHGGGIEDPNKVDAQVKRLVENITTCKSRRISDVTVPPLRKVKIIDRRKKQLSLLEMFQ